jgi:hypothetical protein
MAIIVGGLPTPDIPDNKNPGWIGWLKGLREAAFSVTQSGTTANRPTAFLWVGRRYWDTDLGIPIWLASVNPSAWVDATGLPV